MGIALLFSVVIYETDSFYRRNNLGIKRFLLLHFFQFDFYKLITLNYAIELHRRVSSLLFRCNHFLRFSYRIITFYPVQSRSNTR